MKIVKALSVLLLVLVVVPTFAQESVTNTVTFNDFSFSFDTTIATHVGITQYLTEPEDVFPAQGLHTHFIISGEQPVDTNLVGIRVYRIDDLAAYEHMQQQLTQLQALLAERRDLTQYVASIENPLPFLPTIAAGQIISARVQYVGTPEVTGISYITAYQEVAEPLIQADFLYTFQGISADGKYYVSAIFRVNPDMFPTEMPTDFNYEVFLDQLPDYLSENEAQLNDAEPEAFVPSISTLDAVVQSFDFES